MANVSIIVPSATSNGLPEAYNRLFESVNKSKKHMPTMSQLRLIQTKMAHDAKIYGPDAKLEREYEIVTDALQLFTDGILKCEGKSEKISLTVKARKRKTDKKALEDEELQRLSIQELIAARSSVRVQKKLQAIAAMPTAEKEFWINSDKPMQNYRISKPAKRSVL